MTPHPDGLLAAKACAQRGCCIFCEEALRGNQRTICGSLECRRAYHRTYRRDLRLGIKAIEAKYAAKFSWCAGGVA